MVALRRESGTVVSTAAAFKWRLQNLFKDSSEDTEAPDSYP